VSSNNNNNNNNNNGNNGKQQHVKVALLGLLTDDASLYRPDSFAGATIDPVIPTTERLLATLLQDGEHAGKHAVDLIIPMTHQSMEEDRTFCSHFGGDVFPIVLGAHDHTPYDETVAKSRIYKTGMDAMNVGIIDIKWVLPPDDDTPTGNMRTYNEFPPAVEARLVPIQSYPPDPDMAARVASHKQLLVELEHARLFRIGSWMDDRMRRCVTNDDNDDKAVFSTRQNRRGPSSGSTALATMLRMGMRCHCALLPAGSVRASKDYDQEAFFTWSDLMAEIPFPTAMTVCYLPGHVLQDTITHSRQGSWADPPAAKGGYIHTCTNIRYNDASRCIESIQDEPFESERLYLTTVPEQFFLGIDNHVPLLEWARRQTCLQHEAAIPAKLLIVEVFSTLLWLQLGSFADLDTDGDGHVTRADIQTRCRDIFGPHIVDLVVDNVMAVADPDNTGYILPLEMMVIHYAATDLILHATNDEEEEALRATVLQVTGYAADDPRVATLMARVHSMLDHAQDGNFQREEIRRAVGTLKQQSLLV
jgi:hypothetical protein